jgi:hypothetical protein
LQIIAFPQALTLAGALVFEAILFNSGGWGHRLAYFAHHLAGNRSRHFVLSACQFF